MKNLKLFEEFDHDEKPLKVGQKVKYFNEICTVAFIHDSGLINLQKKDGYFYYNVHPSMYVKPYDAQKFEEYNIPMLWDDDNIKAVKGYTNIGKDTLYMVAVDKPFKIETKDREDYAKLKLLLLRYKIPFTEKIEKIED